MPTQGVQAVQEPREAHTHPTTPACPSHHPHQEGPVRTRPRAPQHLGRGGWGFRSPRPRCGPLFCTRRSFEDSRGTDLCLYHSSCERASERVPGGGTKVNTEMWPQGPSKSPRHAADSSGHPLTRTDALSAASTTRRPARAGPLLYAKRLWTRGVFSRSDRATNT